MSSRPFFLTRSWIGKGEMITGILVAGYCFVEIVRYPRHGPVLPLFGDTSMAFSTAVLFFLSGLAWFWNGWDKIINGYRDRTEPLRFTGTDIAHIAAAIISALAAAFVALIAITK